MADVVKRGRRPGPIRFRTFLRNTILKAFLLRGWKEADEKDEDWDIGWMDRDWMGRWRGLLFSSSTRIKGICAIEVCL